MLAAAPLLLGGLLPLDPALEQRWTWAGAWYFPVGDSFAVAAPWQTAPPFQVTRNVQPRGHQGADLSNRRGGDPVRAAANGIVVLAGTGEDPRGFGVHVVLAHRGPDGGCAYSVYAHLERRSVSVRRGEAVVAGQIIGRVGRSGRATSPHLHFEIRVPALPGERWEKAEVVDPVAFVAARLPGHAADTTWARPWLLWAESAAIVTPGAQAHRPLTHGEWWCTLGAALALDGSDLASDPAAARQRLAAAGMSPSGGPDEAARMVGWSELAADLEQAENLAWRLPAAPLAARERRRRCADLFGGDCPDRAARTRTAPAEPPTRAQVCLLLATRAGEPRPALGSRDVQD
jgi:hypothetical protein